MKSVHFIQKQMSPNEGHAKTERDCISSSVIAPRASRVPYH